MRLHDLKPRSSASDRRKRLDSIVLIVFAGVVLLFPQKILLMLGGSWNIKLFSDAARALNEGSMLYLSICALVVLAIYYFLAKTRFANQKSGGPKGL
jgi:preprotein translocase subunit SecY